MITWPFKHFKELTLDELYAIMALREQVFTLEQQCREPDYDFYDQKAWHLMACDQGKLVAYGRLFAQGDYHQDAASFGRLVVAPAYRGQGLARQIIHKAIEFLTKSETALNVIISAQTYLIELYQQMGFEVDGDIYDEGGLPHQRMRLRV